VDVISCLPADSGVTGLVSWVIDGQTFVIDIAGRQQTVRLLGISAEPLTAEVTRSLLDRRVVRLVSDGASLDDQGRLLRYVLYLDGRFINDELLRSGAARLDKDSSSLACGAQFASAEEFAVQAGLGIWGYSAVAALPTNLQPTGPAVAPTVTAGPAIPPSLTPTVTPATSPSGTSAATTVLSGTQAFPTNTLPPTVTSRLPVAASATSTPSRTATQPVTTGTVVASGVQIVHIFYDGVKDPYEPDEYIEIKNFANTPVDLTNWFVFEVNDSGIFFFPEFTLQPGRSCRIYTYEVHDDSCVQDSIRSYFAVWGNNEDCGLLYDLNDEERSSFCYGTPP
jgi:endonuclease YncB( thermonuclease family)